jgi:hypothetical protein
MSPSTPPSRVVLIFPSFQNSLPYVPSSLNELYESVMSMAYSNCMNYNIMDYFLLSYKQDSKNLNISITSDKIYQVVLKASSSATLEIHCERKSFMDMFDIDIEENEYEDLQESLRDLRIFLNSSRERVAGFFKAIYRLSQLAGKMSVFMQYSYMKYAITGLLFALCVDSAGKFDRLKLSVKAQSPYIEMSTEAISNDVVDIVRQWNDAMYELRKLKPQVAQIYTLFQYTLHNIESAIHKSDRATKQHYIRIQGILLRGFEACEKLKSQLEMCTCQIEEIVREMEREGIEEILKKISCICSLAMADTLDKSVSLFRLRPSNKYAKFYSRWNLT